MRDIFQGYHANNFWGDPESVSGPGSTMVATTTLRDQLPTVFAQLGISNVLDAACGDFQWMRMVMHHTRLPYLGYDIVPELVALNNERYGTDRIEFRVCDITRDTIRRADLILARDVLVHFSHIDCNRALKNFRASGGKWLLATTFPGAGDTEIETGQWRAMDLTRLRYGLGPAKLLLPEYSTPQDGPFANKSLGLWQLNP